MKISMTGYKSGSKQSNRETSNKLVKISNMVLPVKRLGPEEMTSSFFKNEKEFIYPAGKVIFMPEDTPPGCLYVLKEGMVSLYRLTTSGKRLLHAHILPGEIFGVRALLGLTTQGNFAEATEDSLLYVIEKQKMLVYLKRRPDLILNLLESACYSLYLLEERLVEAIYSPIPVRVAHFLLDNTDSVSGLINMTHEDIGDIIGAVRQTVTEALTLLKKRGLVVTRRKQIEVIDRPGLEEFISEVTPIRWTHS